MANDNANNLAKPAWRRWSPMEAASRACARSRSVEPDRNAIYFPNDARNRKVAI